jgi:hypothetical protein
MAFYPEFEQEPSRPHQCIWVNHEGVRCRSYAMRNKYTCFHHQSPDIHDVFSNDAFPIERPQDRASIQQSIADVVQRIAANQMDLKRAGILLYGLQIASANLRDRLPAPALPDSAQPHPNAGQPAPASAPLDLWNISWLQPPAKPQQPAAATPPDAAAPANPDPRSIPAAPSYESVPTTESAPALAVISPEPSASGLPSPPVQEGASAPGARTPAQTDPTLRAAEHPGQLPSICASTSRISGHATSAAPHRAPPTHTPSPANTRKASSPPSSTAHPAESGSHPQTCTARSAPSACPASRSRTRRTARDTAPAGTHRSLRRSSRWFAPAIQPVPAPLHPPLSNRSHDPELHGPQPPETQPRTPAGRPAQSRR